jgi:hypothetical protein
VNQKSNFGAAEIPIFESRSVYLFSIESSGFMEIAIYLAGSIKKGHENSDAFYWTEKDMNLIKQNLREHQVCFLNPAFRTDDLTDQFSVFGRDMTQVFSSNFVFVDARDRRGLGVGAEMMWAKLHKIPVITGRRSIRITTNRGHRS